jgi:transposase
MDCCDRSAIARPAGELRQLELEFCRFRRWAVKGVFDFLFERLSGDPDLEYAMIDGTIVRVHQQGTGARGGLIVRRSDGPAAD